MTFYLNLFNQLFKEIFFSLFWHFAVYGPACSPYIIDWESFPVYSAIQRLGQVKYKV